MLEGDVCHPACISITHVDRLVFFVFYCFDHGDHVLTVGHAFSYVQSTNLCLYVIE
jgi:hypothetical protein